MKEQDKTPEQLSEVETGNVPEKEFRVLTVKITEDLRKRREAQTKRIQEMFNEELEDLKNKQRWTITEMKITLEGIHNRINEQKNE